MRSNSNFFLSLSVPGAAIGFAILPRDQQFPTLITIAPSTPVTRFAVGEFYIGLRRPPVALCKNPATGRAGADCRANVSVDNGSSDPDGSPLTLSQSPPGPYAIGYTPVILTVIDEDSFQHQCTGSVIVENYPPVIQRIPNPGTIVFVDTAGVPENNGKLEVDAVDPEGQPLTYRWTASNCLGATIVGASTSTPTLSFAATASPGPCGVSLRVCDPCGGCTDATVEVSLNDIGVRSLPSPFLF